MKKPLKKIQHAWHGILAIFRTESSFRFQVAVAIILVAVLFALPLEAWVRALLFFVAIFVLVVESINTTQERVLDIVHPRWKEEVGMIKDMLAGTVLLAVIGAVLLGFILLGPTILTMYTRV